MFRLFSVVSLVLMAVFSSVAVSAETNREPISMKDPQQLIEQASERTFARFRQDRQLIEKDINHLKVIVEEELMPYVNHSYAAAKVLGRNYAKLKTKEQKAAFFEVFRRYLIVTYANVFTLYDDQKVTYAPAKDVGSSRTAQVKVTIIDANRPPIKIDFKLRKGKKSGNWRAFDMVAEGISMVSSKRTEFNSIIRKHGIDYLMTKLDEKAQQSVEAKVKS
ncbi:phospholipid-binding protein MlaC [Psychrobium sp. 1_MG-2023]|uniref:MlaC/ttg2D family ABC transporter substrate-binding protein n=1 Tax=Psychrobium sp. 1_MG-2023 TaxID=3062624 RepID=UPI000C34DCAF|nr:ABC transporter substrate-binding protein [Psychrobium sp. 1_MG-2023]MDP2560695.1 ABC transporter substrate-binding protein [Psychrobium sp. 1_MG-2023]PKF56590.1 toluene tolerance protein [Alteromonadales bacterium alter-6D02]